MAEPAPETKKIVNPRVEIDTSPPFESVKEAVDRFGGSGPWIPHHLLRLASDHHNHDEGFDMENIGEQTVKLERDLIMKEQQTLNVLKELESAKRFVESLKINLMPGLSSFMSSPDLKLDGPVNLLQSSEGLTLCHAPSPGMMFMELNQAKMNLNKTSVDLAVIQASIESLNKKMRKDKSLLERRSKMHVQNCEGLSALEENHHISKRKAHVDQKVEVGETHGVSNSMTVAEGLNFEAEQFKKMTEASRYEVMKAMAEIERTKNSIKMAEMRLNAAKKMEEAAKAVEAIAIAEKSALLKGGYSSASRHKPNDGITLSFEDYRALTKKAQQAEDLCKTKFVDTNAIPSMNEAHQLEVPILEKFEQTANGNIQSNEEGPDATNVVIETCFMEQVPMQNYSNKFKFRNSHTGNRNSNVLNGNDSTGARDRPTTNDFRSTTSIGDILSRKLILRDDVVLGRHVENHSERQHISLSQERQHISLSQMLREQSQLILHPTKPTSDGNVEKQYFVQRKKFGFIHVPIPTKQSKKKTQPLNQR